MGRNELKIREKILLVALLIGWVFGSVYGLHNDWTAYIIVCPLIWIPPGMLIAHMEFGKKPDKKAYLTGILSVPIIASAAFMLIHRDTDFIIGRLVLTITMALAIIMASEIDKEQQ